MNEQRKELFGKRDNKFIGNIGTICEKVEKRNP